MFVPISGSCGSTDTFVNEWLIIQWSNQTLSYFLLDFYFWRSVISYMVKRFMKSARMMIQLDVWMEIYPYWTQPFEAYLIVWLPCFLYFWSMMIYPKACFSKHSQWPSKCFRLRQAWEHMLLLSFLGCLKFIFRLCLILHLFFPVFLDIYNSLHFS